MPKSLHHCCRIYCSLDAEITALLIAENTALLDAVNSIRGRIRLIDYTQLMRAKYESLICFTYGYTRPTGTNGALADIYDWYINSPSEEKMTAMREICSYIDHALNHIIESVDLSAGALSTLQICPYRLYRPSKDTIASVIEDAGLALGIFEEWQYT